MSVGLIAALDDEGGIGYKGGLPWPKISEDLKRFKAATIGSKIVMGRKTFDSLGRPLSRRYNLVVTTDPHSFWKDHIACDLDAFSNLDRVFSLFQKEKLWVIGGGEIYRQSLPYATELSLTRIAGTYPADTFWKPDLTGWTCIKSEGYFEDDRHICTFENYVRETPEKIPSLVS